MKILVEKIINKETALAEAMNIRQQVFVIEQNVPAEEEYDEYEATAQHFLASADGQPAGTARWRFTDKGVKLERFAVQKAFRSSGVGSALLQAVLADIEQNPETIDKKKYLHAQITAMGLYTKFGFVAEGEMFQECDIDHFKMVKA